MHLVNDSVHHVADQVHIVHDVADKIHLFKDDIYNIHLVSNMVAYKINLVNIDMTRCILSGRTSMLDILHYW